MVQGFPFMISLFSKTKKSDSYFNSFWWQCPQWLMSTLFHKSHSLNIIDVTEHETSNIYMFGEQTTPKP